MLRKIPFVLSISVWLVAVGCSSDPSPAPATTADVAADTQSVDTASDTVAADVVPGVAGVDVPALDLAGPKTWEVKTTAANTFEPSDLTIAVGDSVHFTVGKIHTATQVNQAIWDANGATPMAGGFDFPGGSSQTQKFDVAGTVYFVCKPHASLGMKGKITVK